MAVELATAGTGVALGRRRPWPWALLAGVFFVAAAAMKVVTLLTALLGFGVVALGDRRQLIRALIGSLVVGALYVLATTLVWVQWMLDIRTVQKDPVAALPDAKPFFAGLVARRPVLALLPAVLMLAGRRNRLRIALAIGLAAVPVVGQGQYFASHSIPLLVVASVAVFRGFFATSGPECPRRPGAQLPGELGLPHGARLELADLGPVLVPAQAHPPTGPGDHRPRVGLLGGGEGRRVATLPATRLNQHTSCRSRTFVAGQDADLVVARSRSVRRAVGGMVLRTAARPFRRVGNRDRLDLGSADREVANVTGTPWALASQNEHYQAWY